MDSTVPGQDQYHDISTEYQQNKAESYRKDLEMPGFLKILGDISGKDVLDLACGEGFYTRLIRERTNGEVYGIDISETMIKLAKSQLTEAQQIVYLVGDGLTFDLDKQFDVICCTYLLQHAENENQVEAFLKNVYKHLKPGGRVIGMDAGVTEKAFNPQDLGKIAKYGIKASIENDEPKEFNKVCFDMVNQKTGTTLQIYFRHIRTPTYERAFKAVGFKNLLQTFPFFPEEMSDTLREFYQDMIDFRFCRYFSADKAE